MAAPTQDLTSAEVAAICHCDPKTVLLAVRRGKLRGYKPGTRNWRFTPDAVAAYRRSLTGTDSLPPPPKTRVAPSRRGAQLPGWHDYDHGGHPS